MRCPHCKHDHDVKCPSCSAVVIDEEVATIGDDADDVPDDQAEPVESITPTDEPPAPIEETPDDAPRGKKTILEHLLGL